MDPYTQQLRDYFAGYEDPRKLRQERQESVRHSFNIMPFLNSAFTTVCTHTPVWSSDVGTASYSLDVAATEIIRRWPEGMEPKEFGKALASFVVGKLAADNYPLQTQAGWFLATMTNILDRQGQSDVIFSDVLPGIYAVQTEKNCMNRVLGRMLPSMREQLDDAVMPRFEEDQRVLLESVFKDKNIINVAGRLMSYLSDGNGMGVYVLQKGCAGQSALLFETLGILRIVKRFAGNSHHWMVASLFSDLFEKASPDQGRILALALYDRLQPQGLIKATRGLVREESWAVALNFNSRVLTGLPRSEKESYAGRLLGLDWKSSLVDSAVYNEKCAKRFIGALPEGAARDIVREMVNDTMEFALEGGPHYWWQSSYANRLHLMMPKKYWPFCEEVVLEHLDADPTNRDRLTRAARLLCGILAETETCRTQEIDFIYLPFPNRFDRHLVLVKPLPSQAGSERIICDQFIGTWEEFAKNLRNPPTGVPRDRPPHHQELSTRYKPYVGILQGIITGGEPVSSGLRETLRSRQNNYLRTAPRALPAPG